MRSTPEEIKSAIERAMTHLYDAKLSLWVTDYDDAKESINESAAALGEIVAEGYSLKRELDDYRKTVKKEHSELNPKLKVGEKIRENQINTDYLFAVELDRTTDRFKKYIEEVLETEIAQEKPEVHQSGVKYRIFSAGPESYDFRARGSFSISGQTPDSLKSKIHSQLQERQLNVTDTRVLDKYPVEGDKLHLIGLRVFLSNAVMNVTILNDGTLTGQIQASTLELAKQLVDITLTAVTAKGEAG